MSMSAKMRRGPMRIVTGAYMLQAGAGKLKTDEQTAKQLHGTASGTYSFLGNVNPTMFAKGLAVSEIAIGGLVLAPFISPVVAGVALIGFAGATLNTWWNTPGMHQEGSPLPTPEGAGIAKDVWLLGIGTGLLADGLLEPAHDKKVELSSTLHEKTHRRAKQGRRARKAAGKAAESAAIVKAAKAAKTVTAKSAKGTAASTKETAKAAKAAAAQSMKDAAKVAKAASKSAAKKASKSASKNAAEAEAHTTKTRAEYAPIVVAKAADARDAAKQLADQLVPVVVARATAVRDGVKQAADQ